MESRESRSWLASIIDPLRWLIEGRVTTSAFWRSLMPLGSTAGIGFLAVTSDQGWDIYGRFEHGQLLDGRLPAEDVQFAASLEAIRTAGRGDLFDMHVGPSADALESLADLTTDLDAQSIEVALLVPPLADPVSQAIAGDPENRLISSLARCALRPRRADL